MGFICRFRSYEPRGLTGNLPRIFNGCASLAPAEPLYLLFRDFSGTDALGGVVSASITSACNRPTSQHPAQLFSGLTWALTVDSRSQPLPRISLPRMVLRPLFCALKCLSIFLRKSCWHWQDWLHQLISCRRTVPHLSASGMLRGSTSRSRFGPRVILLFGQSLDDLPLSPCSPYVPLSALGYDKLS